MATTLEYLDRAGVQTLAKSLLEKVNTKITERMVTSVSADSSDLKVPTAKAVYLAIQSGIAGITQLSFQVVEGLITSVDSPSESVMYLQRDDSSDKTWVLYIYRNSTWIAIGDTSIDLVDYWKKTDTEELKEALGIDTLEEDLESLQASFEEHTSSLSKLSDEDIQSIVNTAFTETAVQFT